MGLLLASGGCDRDAASHPVTHRTALTTEHWQPHMSLVPASRNPASADTRYRFSFHLSLNLGRDVTNARPHPDAGRKPCCGSCKSPLQPSFRPFPFSKLFTTLAPPQPTPLGAGSQPRAATPASPQLDLGVPPGALRTNVSPLRDSIAPPHQVLPALTPAFPRTACPLHPSLAPNVAMAPC